MIVTEPAHRTTGAQMESVPDRKGPGDTWWRLSEECLGRMLDVVGFDVAQVTRSQHMWTGGEPRSFDHVSLVAQRPAPAMR